MLGNLSHFKRFNGNNKAFSNSLLINCWIQGVVMCVIGDYALWSFIEKDTVSTEIEVYDETGFAQLKFSTKWFEIYN